MVFGISVGFFAGNLSNGVTVNVDLFIAVGSVTVYLKNGNEFWVKYNLKPTFGSPIADDTKVVTLPNPDI